MTRDQTADVLSIVAARYPKSDLGSPAVALAEWHATLGAYELDQVEAALNRLHTAGIKWAPSSGEVVKEIELQLAGQPLGFDEMLTAIARAVPGRLYHPSGVIDRAATAEAIAHLQARGVHETACRFVAQHGLSVVWRIPCGDTEPLDQNQDANRRDMARSYERTTVADWERDRRVGVGLERACLRAELDPAETLELAAGQVRQLQARAETLALPAPADQADDEELVEFDFNTDVLGAMCTQRERRQTERAARIKEQAERDIAARRAAERDLAEHAARRRQTTTATSGGVA